MTPPERANVFYLWEWEKTWKKLPERTNPILDKMIWEMGNLFSDFILERNWTWKAWVAKDNFLLKFNTYETHEKKLYLDNVVKDYFSKKSPQDCNDENDDILQLNELILWMSWLDRIEIYSTIRNACSNNNQTFQQTPQNNPPIQWWEPGWWRLEQSEEYIPFEIIWWTITQDEITLSRKLKPWIKEKTREILTSDFKEVLEWIYEITLETKSSESYLRIWYRWWNTIKILNSRNEVIDSIVISKWNEYIEERRWYVTRWKERPYINRIDIKRGWTNIVLYISFPNR